jgi:hypothetical protein
MTKVAWSCPRKWESRQFDRLAHPCYPQDITNLTGAAFGTRCPTCAGTLTSEQPGRPYPRPLARHPCRPNRFLGKHAFRSPTELHNYMGQPLIPQRQSHRCFAARLLRADVGQRPGDGPRKRGQRRARQTRHAKITQHRLGVERERRARIERPGRPCPAQQDVARLDVPMDDTALVRVIERRGE